MLNPTPISTPLLGNDFTAFLCPAHNYGYIVLIYTPTYAWKNLLGIEFGELKGLET